MDVALHVALPVMVHVKVHVMAHVKLFALVRAKNRAQAVQVLAAVAAWGIVPGDVEVVHTCN